MSEPLDRAIAGVAGAQHRNVTRTQLLELGLTRSAITRRVRAGRLYPSYRGVYGVGGPPVTPLERASAAVLACGPGAVLGGRSAVTLWGFWKRWDTPLEVIVPGDRRPRGITVHRSTHLTGRHVTKQLGIPVTTPARTIFDVAPTRTAKQLSRLVNDALLSPYLTRTQLAEMRDLLPNHPAAQLLQPFVDATDGPSRSPFEDDLPGWCEAYNLPRPLTNVMIAGRERDAYFPAERLIVELDGYDYHSGRYAFEDDRERDAQALALGIATVRITRERLRAAPGQEAARLNTILKQRRPAA